MMQEEPETFQRPPQRSDSSIFRETARSLFGTDSGPYVERWIQYWQETRRRNERLLSCFEAVVPMEFRLRKVLDIGCGAGGLAEILTRRGARYAGGDVHRHVLKLSQESPGASFLQCVGERLPFRSESFDYIFAFDVLEHLSAGARAQARFLRELRRTLRRLGMIFLTTPNWWYPYDAHSELLFPHYLPSVFLRDRYVRLRNPAFLKEHGSFANIRMVRPGFLRRSIRDAGLLPLHELPCCMDRAGFARLHPLWGWLTYCGLGWHVHAEFWPILVRAEERDVLRLKLRANWRLERNQPSDGDPDFQPSIDFSAGPAGRQLGDGWYWYERDRTGFRWTRRQAQAYLQSDEPCSFVGVYGYSPFENLLTVRVDGVEVGTHSIVPGEPFDLHYLIPFPDTSRRIFTIELQCGRMHRSRDERDERELGVMIFSLALHS